MWRGASKAATEAADFSKPLADRLLEITANVRQLVPADRLEAPQRAITELQREEPERRMLHAGDAAPVFVAPDTRGTPLSSADLLARGPLIVNFFRGRWCPYCIAELEAWQHYLPQVAAAGAQLVGISPQTVRHNDFTAQQHRLTFPLLSDTGNAVAGRFGVAWQLPDYLVQHYQRIFVNLQNLNGDSAAELPLPATFVIAQNGSIVFAEAYADFRLRPEPRHALTALQSC